MIIKNDNDVERFIAHDGQCGEGSGFCSQSCAQHGRHVAVTSDGRVFARGLHQVIRTEATIHRGEPVTLGEQSSIHRASVAA